MKQREFEEVVNAFFELSSTIARFPLHVIHAGFSQDLIAGPDKRHGELMQTALQALLRCQETMLHVKIEMQKRYGEVTPEVSAGPHAVGTMRKARVDASGFKVIEGGIEDAGDGRAEGGGEGDAGEADLGDNEGPGEPPAA